MDWTSGFIACNEGWLACSSSTIMVDELVAEGGVETTYETMPQSSHLIVDSILDIGQRSKVVRIVDRSPMVVVNRVGQPRKVLSTFVSFPMSHAYREGGLGLVWDTCLQRLVEPNANEGKRAMGFPTRMTSIPSISEASHR
jgi:hypothetical protein